MAFPTNTPITNERFEAAMLRFDAVFDLLKEVFNVREDVRDDLRAYVASAQEGDFNAEYRIGGNLGFGGKFRYNRWRGFRVDYYPEDHTTERGEACKQVNEVLERFFD